MLHLIPLVAYISVSAATLPATVRAEHHVVHRASVTRFLPRLRMPWHWGRTPARDSSARAHRVKPTPSKAAMHASRKPIALVDRRLRDLVAQQESWYVREGRYSHNAYRAGQLRKGDSLAFEQVQVEVLFAGKSGWSALASHPAAPGMTCVVFVGYKDRLPYIPRTHQDAREALLEGIPACDNE